MARRERGVIVMVLRNFIESLKPKQFKGTLVGKDYFGNEYFEIPANPQTGKRKASRWFEPAVKDDFEQEMPAEWEAWLRGRRKEPPLEEEVMRNKAIMELKKENAKKIEDAKPKTSGNVLEKEQKGMQSFPTYDEYESMPGKTKQP